MGTYSFLLQSKGQEKNLLRELALSREQLKRDLAAARQELELVAGAADAAKEEAAVQMNMLSRQLTAAQAQAVAAEKVREQLLVRVCSPDNDYADSREQPASPLQAGVAAVHVLAMAEPCHMPLDLIWHLLAHSDNPPITSTIVLNNAALCRLLRSRGSCCQRSRPRR
jgi:hypothetical protein